MSALKIIEAAIARKVTIATAESCTGGMIGAALTAIAGSSAVYEGGVVSYSNGLKMKLLGVSSDTLKAHGAVSGQTASEMASGALALGVDYAVAVTGIAGPGGGSREKRVGLVYIAVASSRGVTIFEKNYGDLGRENVRENTRDDALELLLKEIIA
jgi:PncC family amidohydrolase